MMAETARPRLLLPSGATISEAGWLGMAGGAWVRDRTYGGGDRR